MPKRQKQIERLDAQSLIEETKRFQREMINVATGAADLAQRAPAFEDVEDYAELTSLVNQLQYGAKTIVDAYDRAAKHSLKLLSRIPAPAKSLEGVTVGLTELGSRAARKDASERILKAVFTGQIDSEQAEKSIDLIQKQEVFSQSVEMDIIRWRIKQMEAEIAGKELGDKPAPPEVTEKEMYDYSPNWGASDNPYKPDKPDKPEDSDDSELGFL